MFERKTVFILGAGASWHYGYPTGEDLVSRVIERAKALSTYFEDGYRNQWGKFPRYALRTVENPHVIPSSVWTGAKQEADELARRLGEVNPTLIDYFLAQNPDLQDIGRLAIALVIFECEAEFNSLGGNQNHILKRRSQIGQGLAPAGSFQLNVASFKDDWLRFVLYALTTRCEQPGDLASNQVTFITFNYDVSLERRLYSGLSNISYFKPNDVAAFMADDRYIHVYGSIRERVDANWAPVDTRFSTSSSFDFTKTTEMLDRVFAASQGIRTIDGEDKVRNTEALIRAGAAIGEAEVVYLLGFGFDSQNVARLALESLRPIGRLSRKVFLTNYGGSNRVMFAAGQALLGTPRAFLNGGPFLVEQRHLNGYEFSNSYSVSEKNVYDAFAEDFESMDR